MSCGFPSITPAAPELVRENMRDGIDDGDDLVVKGSLVFLRFRGLLEFFAGEKVHHVCRLNQAKRGFVLLILFFQVFQRREQFSEG